jgi:D-alanyl-D-alanine carboxypeptidase/D-alanyl-D-alanine-endopeptidase (penicillin-binding protein 4)
MFFLALLLAAHPAGDKINALLRESPSVARSHWGAHFVELKSGKTVYARNEQSFFIPASNTKLFSTALALMRLGPDHRFTTRLLAGGPLDANGTLTGDLIFAGGGDPTLSGRPIPYAHKTPFNDPLGPLRALVEQAWENGLRRVSGGIIGDDTRYVWDPYPVGWSQDDTLYDYGAPVSALILHDNFIRVHLSPGEKAGDLAKTSLNPALPYFFLNSRVTTAAAKPTDEIRVHRAPGSRLIELSGEVALQNGATLELAVDDPARYAAFALRAALRRRGIQVDGDISARHRSPLDEQPELGGLELAKRVSPPIVESLKVTDKVSQNLQAEIALREVSRDRGHEGARKGGIDELKSFLAEIGIPPGDYNFEDGSGLSRLTLVTPAALTRLLRYMDGARYRDQWIELLPIGGEDGTLALRYKDLKEGRVLAKTGTISHVGALSGYIETRRGEWLAFSVIVNNANARGPEIRQFIDRLVMLFVE